MIVRATIKPRLVAIASLPHVVGHAAEPQARNHHYLLFHLIHFVSFPFLFLISIMHFHFPPIKQNAATHLESQILDCWESLLTRFYTR